VLYHLRYPLLALERIRSVTSHQLILETSSLIPALLVQDRRVGCLLRERVLEEVLSLGRVSPFAQELGPQQMGEGSIELALARVKGAQRGVPDEAPDHRCPLERRLGGRGQPIDSGRDQPAEVSGRGLRGFGFECLRGNGEAASLRQR
jgi:hypothetical protein